MCVCVCVLWLCVWMNKVIQYRPYYFAESERRGTVKNAITLTDFTRPLASMNCKTCSSHYSKWMSAKLCKYKSGFWSKATHYVEMNWFHAWFTCYLSHKSWAFSVRFLEKRKWCQDFFRVAKILQQLLMFLFYILPHAFLSTVEHKRRNINNVLVIFFYIIIFYTLFSCIWKYIHTYISLLKLYNTWFVHESFLSLAHLRESIFNK